MNIKKAITAKYHIQGLNIERLLNKLAKEGIDVFSVHRPKQNVLRFSVRLSDDQKVFAILKGMCYNIKTRKIGGYGYPLYFLLKRPGIVLGAAIFLFAALFADNTIFRFQVTGSGAVYGQEIIALLNDSGIEEGKRFSSVDFDSAENLILRNFERLSFVTVRKHGNTLLVDAAMSGDKPPVVDTAPKDVVSDVSGTLSRAVVLRGTLLVKPGDEVREGDVLVGGYYYAEAAQDGEQIPTYVLCDLWIDTQKTFVFGFDGVSALETALAEEMAKGYIDGEIKEILTEVYQDGQELSVTVKYVRHITGG